MQAHTKFCMSCYRWSFCTIKTILECAVQYSIEKGETYSLKKKKTRPALALQIFENWLWIEFSNFVTLCQINNSNWSCFRKLKEKVKKIYESKLDNNYCRSQKIIRNSPATWKWFNVNI